MKSLPCLLIVVLLLFFEYCHEANSYENGAPCSAVESMEPAHGVKDVLNPKFDAFNKLRFTDEQDRDILCYNHHKPIRVRFDTEKHEKFRGFAIQARTKDKMSRTGSFLLPDNEAFLRMHCDEPGAVTHTNADNVLSTSTFYITWIPSRLYNDSVYFAATIAIEKLIWRSQIGGFCQKLPFDASCTIIPITCTGNNIKESKYTGNWTCGKTGDDSNEYFHVEESSKATVNGPHFVCNGCEFEILQNSTYISIGGSVKLEGSATMKFVEQNVTLQQSSLSLTGGLKINGNPHQDYKDQPRNMKVINSQLSLAGFMLTLPYGHLVEIENSQVDIHVGASDKHQTFQFSLNNYACLKWNNAIVNVGAESIDSEIEGTWVMKRDSKIISTASGFNFKIKPSLITANNMCREKGLFMSAGSEIILKSVNTEFIIGADSHFLIADRKKLEILGNFKFELLDNSEFKLHESIRLDAGGGSHSFKIVENTDCTFRSDKNEDKIFLVNETVTIQHSSNYTMQTSEGIETFNCNIKPKFKIG